LNVHRPLHEGRTSTDREAATPLRKKPMKEPGLDGRHRDKDAPKAGEIQQKRSDTLNKNLPTPIPQFSPNATLGTMRKVTGQTSVDSVRRAAAQLRRSK